MVGRQGQPKQQSPAILALALWSLLEGKGCEELSATTSHADRQLRQGQRLQPVSLSRTLVEQVRPFFALRIRSCGTALRLS